MTRIVPSGPPAPLPAGVGEPTRQHANEYQDQDDQPAIGLLPYLPSAATTCVIRSHDLVTSHE
jgi:hypothetical protein